MKQKTFEVQVKIKKGQTAVNGYELVRTQISAQTPYQAQQIAEGLYGKGSLVGMPREVR